MWDAGRHGQSSPARGPLVVMIVDDHARFRSAMRHWIAALHADFEWVEAGSAEEALALASALDIQIALMDVTLPGMNGLEATRRLKDMLPEVAVIIVSQHAGDAYVERARAAGAFAYITKDRVCRDLLPTVSRALGRGPSGGGHGEPQ